MSMALSKRVGHESTSPFKFSLLTRSQGEICALMGPSGCGKTTLLNVLAHRDAASGAKVEGTTLVNGQSPSVGPFRRMTSYVEQEDALIGSLTVKETMHFAARLAHKKWEPFSLGAPTG